MTSDIIPAQEDRDIEQLIAERDAAEDALSSAFSLVVGRPVEWSNLFGYREALAEIEAARHRIETESRLQSQTVSQGPEVGELVERLEWADLWVREDGDGTQHIDGAPIEAAGIIRALQVQVERMREALETAAAWFEQYAGEHRAKAKAFTGQDQEYEWRARMDKSDRNADRAAYCRAALTPNPKIDYEG